MLLYKTAQCSVEVQLSGDLTKALREQATEHQDAVNLLHQSRVPNSKLTHV